MANQDKETAKGLLKRFAENEKARRILVLIGIGAIGLIFVSSYFSSSKKTAETQPAAVQAGITTGEYTTQLEANLTRLVSGIDGVGEVTVMVTLEKGVEHIYATQEKKSQQTTEDKASEQDVKNQAQNQVETSYILVKDADGSQRALSVTEVQPVVKGVVVVCEGGDNPTVQQNVTEAVTTALNISSARVCVVKAK